MGQVNLGQNNLGGNHSRSVNKFGDYLVGGEYKGVGPSSFLLFVSGVLAKKGGVVIKGGNNKCTEGETTVFGEEKGSQKG